MHKVVIPRDEDDENMNVPVQCRDTVHQTAALTIAFK